MGFPECLDTLNQAETASQLLLTVQCGLDEEREEGGAPMGFPEFLDTPNQAEHGQQVSCYSLGLWVLMWLSSVDLTVKER